MEVHCDACGSENAYHNGVCYVCPDCGNEWDDGCEPDDEEDEEY